MSNQKFKIAILLTARSGFHRTVGKAIIDLLQTKRFGDRYKGSLFFISSFSEESFNEQLSRIIEEKYDIIFSIGFIITRMLHRVILRTPSWNIPVVFSGIKLPVEEGLVDSAHKPGGWMTGIIREGASPLMQAYLIEQLPVDIKKILIPIAPEFEMGYLPTQIRLLREYLQLRRNIQVDSVIIEKGEVVSDVIRSYLLDDYKMVLFLEGCHMTESMGSLSRLCSSHNALLFGDGPEAVRMGADFGYGGGNESFAVRGLALIQRICEKKLHPGKVPLSRMNNNRLFWLNRRVFEERLLTRAFANSLQGRMAEARIKFLSTVIEDDRQN